MTLSPDDRYSVNPEARMARMGGRTVVLHPEDGGLYDLNAVAEQVWEWLQSERTMAELGGLLTASYCVDLETATRDLGALLSDLQASGLIRRTAI